MDKIIVAFGKNRRNKIFDSSTLDRLRRIGTVVLNETEGDPSEEEIVKIGAGGTILITSWGCPQISERILEAMPELKLIVHAAGSVKGIVGGKVWERNIKVVSSASELGKGVAETALGLTVASLKNFWELQRDTREGNWGEHIGQVSEVFKKKIGVLGAGWAGRHYIKLMQNFSVEILLSDPYIPEEEADRMGVRLVGFPELLRESDVVSVHAPSLPETFHMFRRETLSMMKKEAVLINTARGSLIDEEDLYNHMKEGNLKYACLDVRAEEPPSRDDMLRTLPNVIMTPHIAGLTNNGLIRIGDFVVNQIRCFLDGRTCTGEVTRAMMDIMA